MEDTNLMLGKNCLNLVSLDDILQKFLVVPIPFSQNWVNFFFWLKKSAPLAIWEKRTWAHALISPLCMRGQWNIFYNKQSSISLHSCSAGPWNRNPRYHHLPGGSWQNCKQCDGGDRIISIKRKPGSYYKCLLHQGHDLRDLFEHIRLNKIEPQLKQWWKKKRSFRNSKG